MNAFEPDERGLVSTCRHCGQRNRLHYERLGRQFRCGKCHSELTQPAEPVAVETQAVFDALTERSAVPVLMGAARARWWRSNLPRSQPKAPAAGW